MRKQTDFEIRVFPLGDGRPGSYSKSVLEEEIRQRYMKDGWEVFNVNVNQVSAGVIFLQVVFIKYEEVQEPAKAK